MTLEYYLGVSQDNWPTTSLERTSVSKSMVDKRDVPQSSSQPRTAEIFDGADFFPARARMRPRHLTTTEVLLFGKQRA